MNIFAFVASIVGSMAAPITVVVALIIFRNPLVDLIGRVTSYEGLGQKVQFGKQLASAEKTVSDAAAQATSDRGRKTSGSTSATPEVEQNKSPDDMQEEPAQSGSIGWDLEKVGLAKVASENPSYTIIRAWEELTGSLERLVATVLPDASPRNPIRLLPELAMKGIVNDSFVSGARELVDLRNRVAHGRSNPTPGEAVAYAEAARVLGNTATMIAGREQGKRDAMRFRP